MPRKRDRARTPGSRGPAVGAGDADGGSLDPDPLSAAPAEFKRVCC